MTPLALLPAPTRLLHDTHLAKTAAHTLAVHCILPSALNGMARFVRPDP